MDVSAESPLLRSDTDGVVRLTLNRPQSFNSLSYALLGLLEAELARIAEDPAARVVVIAGAGKAFCAGHDLKEMGADLRDAPVRALFDRCSAVMTALTRLPQPADAEYGQQVGLALAADPVAKIGIALQDGVDQFSAAEPIMTVEKTSDGRG